MAASVFFAPAQEIALSQNAGGGTRTRTELSLQRILSRLIIVKNSLIDWLYFHQM
jgi:hypothetical protein